MKNLNYYVEKNNLTNEIVYIEYDKIKGYKITPKTKLEDGIKVNKIVFVSPSLSKNLIKKKLEIKLRHMIELLGDIDDDESGDAIRETLMECERLKLLIINKYIKYLGNDMSSFYLKKTQLIINELRKELYLLKQKKYQALYYYEEENRKQGRGR